MELKRPLDEFIAATFTPLRENGAVAPDVISGYAAFLASGGIRTVFITGTTGECHSLTLAEKLDLYDAWAAAGPRHGVAVIAHVGGNSIEDARRLARRARELELAALSSLAPSYYKPVTLDALVDWCAAIAAEAPDLPFFYYDIPALTSVSVPIELFLVRASARIPNLAGVKFTNPDLVSYRRSLDVAGERLDLPWGMDEALLGGLATGARCAVGSTYNFAHPLYQDLRMAFERGELAEARRLQSRSIAIVQALDRSGYLGTAKALLTHLGVPLGPARAPLANPTPRQVDSMLTRLSELGISR